MVFGTGSLIRQEFHASRCAAKRLLDVGSLSESSFALRAHSSTRSDPKDLAEAKHFAEARRGSGGGQRTRGGEFGSWIEDPPDQQGKDEIAAAIAVRATSLVRHCVRMFR
jgi:hypothetical protein